MSYANRPLANGILECEALLQHVLAAMSSKPTKTVMKVCNMLWYGVETITPLPLAVVPPNVALYVICHCRTCLEGTRRGGALNRVHNFKTILQWHTRHKATSGGTVASAKGVMVSTPQQSTQAAFLNVRTADKSSNLNKIMSFDDGQWAKWCAEPMLLLHQHLQRLKCNDRILRQVMQKKSQVQAAKLENLLAVMLVSVKTEQQSEDGDGKSSALSMNLAGPEGLQANERLQ